MAQLPIVLPFSFSHVAMSCPNTSAMFGIAEVSLAKPLRTPFQCSEAQMRNSEVSLKLLYSLVVGDLAKNALRNILN